MTSTAAAAAAGAAFYLDPVEFTRLFKQRWKNFSAICIGLQKLVSRVRAAPCWSWASEDDRRDVEANVLLTLIRRVDRFRFQRGKNAYSYYTVMAFHEIGKEIRRLARSRGRCENFSDLTRRLGQSLRHSESPLHTARSYAAA